MLEDEKNMDISAMEEFLDRLSVNKFLDTPYLTRKGHVLGRRIVNLAISS
jgi:hypothetical protein